jgi:hypothetical protein
MVNVPMSNLYAAKEPETIFEATPSDQHALYKPATIEEW